MARPARPHRRGDRSHSDLLRPVRADLVALLGENWRAFSATVAPSTSVDAPSTPAKMGDYDRLGRRIAWAATDDPVYASQHDGPAPAPLSFSDVDTIAKEEHMSPAMPSSRLPIRL